MSLLEARHSSDIARVVGTCKRWSNRRVPDPVKNNANIFAKKSGNKIKHAEKMWRTKSNIFRHVYFFQTLFPLIPRSKIMMYLICRYFFVHEIFRKKNHLDFSEKKNFPHFPRACRTFSDLRTDIFRLSKMVYYTVHIYISNKYSFISTIFESAKKPVRKSEKVGNTRGKSGVGKTPIICLHKNGCFFLRDTVFCFLPRMRAASSGWQRHLSARRSALFRSAALAGWGHTDLYWAYYVVLQRWFMI